MLLPWSKTCLNLLACLTLTGVVLSAEDPGEFKIRPVSPLDTTHLDSLRSLVATDAAAGRIARQVLAAAAAITDRVPRPLAEISYEGLVNTDPRRIASVTVLRQLDEVAALVRAWQLSGEADLAQDLRHFVQAWAGIYRPTGNDVNENKLVPLIVAWHQVGAGGTADERRSVEAWLLRLGQLHRQALLKRGTHLTNRYTKSVRLVALLGLACGQKAWLDEARQGIERFVCVGLRPDGGSLDLEMRDALSYHCSGLIPPLEVALLLGPAGRQIYAWQAPSGASLERSVALVLPYARGEQQHAEWVNTKVDLDRRRADEGLPHYQTGRIFQPWEARALISAASCFDPRLRPLLATLRAPAGQGSEDDTPTGEASYPDWSSLVHAAVARAADPQP